MELLVIVLIAMAIYLFKDNKKQAVENHDPIDRAWKLGSGWLIIVAIVAVLLFSVIPFMITGEMVNVGRNSDGSFTMHQESDPNNKLHRPIGEVLGMEQDANGHWSRAR